MLKTKINLVFGDFHILTSPLSRPVSHPHSSGGCLTSQPNKPKITYKDASILNHHG